jgi:aminomethyltransferase
MSTQLTDIGFGTQIRKSPYFEATLRYGAQAFSVYNHMYIPRDFGDSVENYWNLVNAAILCDVAVERQVEMPGWTVQVRAYHQRGGRHHQ